VIVPKTWKKPGSTLPKFTTGQKVNVSILGRQAVISKSPFWNGFTWMYSFQNEEVCCGECYLSLCVSEVVDVERDRA
jgi:hypothetical protein